VKTLAAILAATFVAACNLFAGSPTFSVELPNNRGMAIDIFDRSGLVASARTGPLAGPFNGAGDVVADSENNTLTIHWLGGSCPSHASVTVIGTAAQLRVVVDDARPPFAACSADGIPFALELTLSATVTQDAVSAEFHL
jgi:hypothetical protein